MKWIYLDAFSPDDNLVVQWSDMNSERWRQHGTSILFYPVFGSQLEFMALYTHMGDEIHARRGQQLQKRFCCVEC